MTNSLINLMEENDIQDMLKKKYSTWARIKIGALVFVMAATMSCAMLGVPKPIEPNPLPRIPETYTHPELMSFEERELFSDVRTSFYPTGSVILPYTRNRKKTTKKSPVSGDGDKKVPKEISRNVNDKKSFGTAPKINPKDTKKYEPTKDGSDSKRHKREISQTRNISDNVEWVNEPNSDEDPSETESDIWEQMNYVSNKKVQRMGKRSSSSKPCNHAIQSFWYNQDNPTEIRSQQAAIMKCQMDANADPCEDFYQYACGNWAQFNPIPADKAGFDTFEMLRENLDTILKELLTSDKVRKWEDTPFTADNYVKSHVKINANLQLDSFKVIDYVMEEYKSHEISNNDDKSSTLNKRERRNILNTNYANKNKTRSLNRYKAVFRNKRDIIITSENLNDNSKLNFIRKQSRIKRKASSGETEEEKEGSIDAVTKAKYLYESCMNYEILAKRGHQPLLDLLASFGGWPIIQPWNQSRFDWVELMALLRLFNNDVLLSEWVGPDIKNSDEFVIQFDQTSLGLPTRDYFLQSSNKIYLEAYKSYLVKVAMLMGASNETVFQSAEDVIKFEVRLAKITSAPEDRRNVSELYHRTTLRELQNTIPKIKWKRYLTVVLNRSVEWNETVVIFALKYAEELVKLVEETDQKIVANYLFWRFVRHRVNNLDDKFQEAKQKFYNTLFGREQAPPRWKNCVTQVNSNMGMALGSMFVREYFDENSKNDTLLMTKEIQDAFREILDHTSWIDDETKTLAHDKVDAMMLRIGYPDFILNEKELNDRYKEVHIRPDTYFENTLHILRHLTRIEQARIGQPVNKTQWNTAPAVVNAYYSRNKNQIMFPAGILQPPFYHKHFPKSLNYGGIGVVIGHEITHGFDDKGRLFDKYGNLHRWWHDDAIKLFHKKAQCLIDQYSDYQVTEVSMSLDGVNTQGENIADNGGIKQSFRAYTKWLEQNGNIDEPLPGLNVSNSQLFFLNFAQVWCGAMRPEAMKNKLKTAVHSPGKFRVIGTVSNSDDFSQVFNCPVGSPMNPVKKCNVW